MLFAETDGSGPRLVLLHGFTQNRNCWGPVATDLAADHEVVRIDLPGHGRSGAVEAGPWDAARLVAARGGRGTYLGYSMGGRLALHVAVAEPEVVQRLVVVGATAGIDDPAARRARVADDERLAGRLEREGLDAFLEIWLAQPLFAGIPEPMRFLAQRLENSASGLASSLRLSGTGVQDPLWDRLGAIDVPVLVVAGEDDEKFGAEARRLTAAIGDNASLALVPAAGHSPHLERPAEFISAVRPFLAG